MAFLMHTSEFSTLSAKIIPDQNLKPNPHSGFPRRRVVCAADRRNWSGYKAVADGRNLSGYCAAVGDDDDTRRLYMQLSAAVEQGSKKGREEEEKQNYYVNIGHAIRTLREEFPHLFYRELSFDIYRDDIVFKDPMNTFTGIQNYKSIFWALRFNGRIFFKALWLDIISIWQPGDDTLMVRWTVHGVLRVPREGRCRFDGTSEYKFDKKGKIYEHRVDNIAYNSPRKFQMMTVQELVQSVAGSSTPKPTYFEISSSSSSETL